MEHDVFISYSHNDSNIADAICNRLESAGIRCWYAPRNIQPGHEWAEAIIEALGKSRIMVLVFTDFSNTSTQVRREVNAAVSSGVTIIPFKCTKSEPSGSMQYYLSTLHWLDAMTDPLERSIDKLKDECISILKAGGSEMPPASEEPVPETKIQSGSGNPPSAVPWRTVAVAAAAVAAIVLCLVLLPKAGGRDPDSTASTAASASDSGTSASSGKSSGSAETAKSSKSSKSSASPSASGGMYSGDPDDDSPGAEYYLYDVSTFYSDVYEKGVCLQKYFGDPADVIEIPKMVDGWPVTYIGDKCFEDMDTIEKVILPDTVESIGYRSFYGCTALTEINLPECLKSTDGWSFAHTGMKEFIAPAGFIDLGYGTFYSCESLKNIELTEAVLSLGADTFAYVADGCTITVPNPDVEVDIKAFREKQAVTVIAPAGSYLETYAKAMSLTFREMD